MRYGRIGMGLIGPGFVATHHVDAVRRLGDVDVIAIAGSSDEAAQRKAKSLRVDKAYGSYRDLIADPAIEVIHNTTPNHLHFEVTMAAIEAGKHVVSDKPLALNYAESAKLRDAAEAAGVVNAVTFNYRGNSLVQQARLMIHEDQIGPVFFIHGHYLQDWMSDPSVYSWRCNPARGGQSSALADIGSHWCDLAQHLCGSRITAVLAELTTVVRTRYPGARSQEAFSASDGAEPHAVTIEGEDLASVLLRFANGAKGSVSVGQVIVGRKNAFEIEVNGRTGSLRWNQERQNELWVGRHDAHNAVLASDPSLLHYGARPYAHMPAGHQEGWSDAFHNVVADIYRWIRAGGNAAEKPVTVCTFADACQVCCVVEAMMRSNAGGGVWEPVHAESPVIAQAELAGSHAAETIGTVTWK